MNSRSLGPYQIGLDRDWTDPEQGEGDEFLQESTEVKNVWVPIGESL